MTYTIAIHGDFATPEMLAQDMGDMSDEVDLFHHFNYKRPIQFSHQLDQLCRTIKEKGEVVLIGYSHGGSIIADVTEYLAREIVGAVLYESPVLRSDYIYGTFPALMIWNDNGASKGIRSNQADRSKRLWKKNRLVTELEGSGGHMKTNPIGHCWDQSLNGKIRDWLSGIK